MKNYKITFLINALKDIQEAKNWYEEQQKGLGKRLLENVRLTVKELKHNPFIGSVKYMEIRTISCSKFPYSIHYSIDETKSEVVIVSIFHLHRKPFWD